jgi:hypothetical protein
MSQLHTCLEGKAIEEIRNFLEGGGGILGGDHQVGGCGFGSCGFDTRGCFLMGFPAAGLGAAVNLCSDFLSLAIFLVAVTLGCLGTSATG